MIIANDKPPKGDYQKPAVVGDFFCKWGGEDNYSQFHRTFNDWVGLWLDFVAILCIWRPVGLEDYSNREGGIVWVTSTRPQNRWRSYTRPAPLEQGFLGGWVQGDDPGPYWAYYKSPINGGGIARAIHNLCEREGIQYEICIEQATKQYTLSPDSPRMRNARRQ